MDTVKDFKRELKMYASVTRAIHSARFFKTGQGEYGYGDVFIGITVPDIRRCVRKYHQLSVSDCVDLLHSPIHEYRLCALLLLVAKYKSGDQNLQQQIFETYVSNTAYINNWDLVDSSASHIVGAHIETRSKKILDSFAHSKNLWERRIAMIATFYFIMKKENGEAFAVATILRQDPHDLIQKAVGWMLREIGKRSGIDVEEQFLKKYYKSMPRTMLRYAIERFPQQKREAYLKGKI